jgi:hypothetical protein
MPPAREARYLSMKMWRSSLLCIICLRPAVTVKTKLDGAVVPYCADHARRKLPTFPEVFHEIRNTRDCAKTSR